MSLLVPLQMDTVRGYFTVWLCWRFFSTCRNIEPRLPSQKALDICTALAISLIIHAFQTTKIKTAGHENQNSHSHVFCVCEVTHEANGGKKKKHQMWFRDWGDICDLGLYGHPGTEGTFVTWDFMDLFGFCSFACEKHENKPGSHEITNQTQLCQNYTCTHTAEKILHSLISLHGACSLSSAGLQKNC